MLRFAMGLDHIKARNVQETWIATSGYGIARKFAVANKGLIVNDEGFLTAAAGNSPSNNTQPYINISPYLETSGYSKLWFGYLFKVYDIRNTANMPALYITSDAAGSSFQSLLTFTEIGQTLNLELQVGVEIDIVNSTVTIWFDSVLFKTITLSGPNKTNLLSGKFWIAFNFTNTNTSGLCGIRDLIVGDDIPGDKMIGYQGPKKLHPIILDEVVGSNWTASGGGSLLDTMMAAPETTPVQTVSNVGPSGNLECSLKAPTIPTSGVAINGVFLQAALKGESGSVVTTLSLKQGNIETPRVQKNLTTTLLYNYSLGTFGSAPDGTDWTVAKIDATKVIITPDA